jgi:hypothetical protein
MTDSNTAARITSFVIVLALFVPSILEAQDRSADVLSAGVTVRGPTQFKREKADATAAPQQQADSILFDFEVNVGSENGPFAMIRLMAKYALDRAYVSSTLYRTLLPGGDTTVRFADVADLSPGTPTSPGSFEGLLQCSASLGRRDAKRGIYGVRCFNIDETRRAKNDAGRFIYEVDIVVSAPNQSLVDQFLLRHDSGLRDINPERDPFVYVRVEK